MVEAEAWGRLHVGKCDFFLGFIGADQDKVAVFRKVLGTKTGASSENVMNMMYKYVFGIY